MENIKNISRVTTILFVGGDDLHRRIPMFRLIKASGFRVVVLCDSNSEKFVNQPFEVIEVRAVNSLLPWRLIQLKKKMERTICDSQVDIVHVFDTLPGMVVPLLIKPGRVLIVRTVTGLGRMYSLGAGMLLASIKYIYELMVLFGRGRLSKTIFQNRTDYQYYMSKNLVLPTATELIAGAGVSLDAITDSGRLEAIKRKKRAELKIETNLVVIMVARLLKSKGVLDYCDLAKRICSKRKDVTFLLVGPLVSGHAGISVRTLSGYSETLRYLGEREDVADLLVASDVFVLPTFYREGIPRVILEAGAVGLPVIATNVPGASDIIRDGVNGYLVAPRNVDMLESRLEFLLESKSTRISMGREARDIISKRFSLDKIVQDHLVLYGKLCETFEGHPSVPPKI